MSLETDTFEFADFRLEVEEKVLLRNGKPVSVTPKAFQLLLLLVRNQGRSVKKSDIMTEVWPNSFVEEGNLTFTINLLRKALGDDKSNPQFIETIPKHGYRFIAEIKTAVEVQPSLSSQQKEVKRHRYLFVFVSVALLLIAGAGLWFYSANFRKTAATAKRSILVLPLKPINTAKRDEIYEIGIAESFIQRLSRINGVVVRPLSAIRKYADIELDSLAAGREQRVDFVLASNYLLAGERVRITAQLLNTETGQIEDTYQTEKNTNDIFAMQEAVANEVGNVLQARFVAVSVSPALSKRGTTNEEAYRLYLQATYLLDKESLADSKRAIGLFDEALALDQNYAKAWAGKARAHCNYAHNGGNSPDAEFAKAKPALERAFALENDLAEAHAVLGIIKSDYEGDFVEGEKQFKQAIELAPNADIFYRWYANRLAAQGRADEAIDMAKTAIDINPNYVVHQIYLARALYYARRYDDAITQLQRVSEIDPNNPLVFVFLWRCFHQKGVYQQAYKSFMYFQKLRGTKEADLRTYEDLYLKAGWPSVLRKSLEISLAQGAKNVNSFSMAYLSALLGEREQTMGFLQEAANNRSLELPSAKGDPAFDGLRDDPRFINILKTNSK